MFIRWSKRIQKNKNGRPIKRSFYARLVKNYRRDKDKLPTPKTIIYLNKLIFTEGQLEIQSSGRLLRPYGWRRRRGDLSVAGYQELFMRSVDKMAELSDKEKERLKDEFIFTRLTEGRFPSS